MHNTPQEISRGHSLKMGGFGLIELLVSISVMVLVTSVILARHDSFNGASLLRGQAYQVALAIREMQMLAVSSTRDASGFRNIYGLVFAVDAPDSYVIFRDDGDYEFSVGEEFGKQGVIDSRFAIDEIRLIGSGVDAGDISDITILFERPNFDARLFKSSGVEVDAGIYAVELDVRLEGTVGVGPGEVRTIEVTRPGQITVKDI